MNVSNKLGCIHGNGLRGYQIVEEQCKRCLGPRMCKRCPGIYQLVIDEFHNFNTKLLAELVTETRKGGLYLIASHQYLAQLEGEQVRKAMLGATGNKIEFQVGIDDAEILARFIDDMSEADFVGMPKYTAVLHNWSGSTEFRTLDVFPRMKRAKKVKKEAHERFAKRIQDVDRQLEYFYR